MSSDDAEFWTLERAQKRFQKHKLCLAEQPTEACNSPIIRAHTIPRSQLDVISQASHVYAFDASMAQLHRGDGNIAVKKFGIGQFSVLNCFCSRHDNDLFRDIESSPLIFSPKQIALLHYRTVASELYRKIRMIEATTDQIATVSKNTSVKHKFAKKTLEALNDGQKLGMRDGKLALDKCSKILKTESYNDLSAVVVRFQKPPSVMTVGGFYPEFDYNGRHLQTLGDDEKEYDTISFNILSVEGSAALAFIWEASHQKCQQFADTLLQQPSNLYTTLAIQTAFEYLENTCMSIGWWDKLKVVERDTLTRRMQYAGGMMHERNGSALQYSGITHDDWIFERVNRINA